MSAPPAGQQRWTLRVLADRLVELGLVEKISHVAVANDQKKRSQTLARKIVVHAESVRPIRGQNGRYLGRLPPSL